MPLSKVTRNRLKELFLNTTYLDDQLVNADAVNLGKEEGERGAACENFAMSGLLGGARISPGAVIDTILFGGEEPGLKKTSKGIHKSFGTIHDPKVNRLGVGKGTSANKTRNKHREKLHNYTAKIFNYILKANGFKMQRYGSKYYVCMEYECASNQHMYPNFTHAWLMYRGEYIIQTITGACISIAQLEAGRPSHCGVIRRGVADFLPTQIEKIEGIVNNPVVINQATMIDPDLLTIVVGKIGTKRNQWTQKI